VVAGNSYSVGMSVDSNVEHWVSLFYSNSLCPSIFTDATYTLYLYRKYLVSIGYCDVYFILMDQLLP